MDQSAVGAAVELAHPPVVNAGPEVVRIADHRRARGARNGRLDFHFYRCQAALHDFHGHRIGTRAGIGGQRAERELGGCTPRGGHESAPSRVTMILRYSSIRTTNPGWMGTVDPNSSITSGTGSTVSDRQSVG